VRGWGGVNRRGIRFSVGCALIIQTILLDPSGAVWTDDAAHVSRLDPSGADQIDAKHPTRNRKVVGSNPTSQETAAQLLDRTRSFLESAGVLRPGASVLDLDHHRLMALVAVYGTVMPWWAGPGWRERPLGHMLKVVPGRRRRVRHAAATDRRVPSPRT
jgi:hypothetical protein